ncbi:hypothetical protein CAOG_06451 [Capsaspora owczarzaki ATCC 30864]|uniref:Uncharacterized protein n=1 Tax=Capsaspora owczarzaki (strain ATCC 30864) TaxID=595528 RepID=A0A0D2X4H7_CAPO3|nr:hypothetical protein CAOG_06451 [Capsaspora owczarzaki ATCC 30864]KJE96079.1 hypothetical protein CAOG_006451 [Capsaspora owczarzaki ATCC 30864]|eukprot:XP_004345200.1 hypothetical protein CAOG_06451 [Capsaspora owczarzaki ATCC 30864]
MLSAASSSSALASGCGALRVATLAASASASASPSSSSSSVQTRHASTSAAAAAAALSVASVAGSRRMFAISPFSSSSSSSSTVAPLASVHSRAPVFATASARGFHSHGAGSQALAKFPHRAIKAQRKAGTLPLDDKTAHVAPHPLVTPPFPRAVIAVPVPALPGAAPTKAMSTMAAAAATTAANANASIIVTYHPLRVVHEDFTRLTQLPTPNMPTLNNNFTVGTTEAMTPLDPFPVIDETATSPASVMVAKGRRTRGLASVERAFIPVSPAARTPLPQNVMARQALNLVPKSALPHGTDAKTRGTAAGALHVGPAKNAHDSSSSPSLEAAFLSHLTQAGRQALTERVNFYAADQERQARSTSVATSASAAQYPVAFSKYLQQQARPSRLQKTPAEHAVKAAEKAGLDAARAPSMTDPATIAKVRALRATTTKSTEELAKMFNVQKAVIRQVAPLTAEQQARHAPIGGVNSDSVPLLKRGESGVDQYIAWQSVRTAKRKLRRVTSDRKQQAEANVAILQSRPQPATQAPRKAPNWPAEWETSSKAADASSTSTPPAPSSSVW